MGTHAGSARKEGPVGQGGEEGRSLDFLFLPLAGGRSRHAGGCVNCSPRWTETSGLKSSRFTELLSNPFYDEMAGSWGAWYKCDWGQALP